MVLVRQGLIRSFTLLYSGGYHIISSLHFIINNDSPSTSYEGAVLFLCNDGTRCVLILGHNAVELTEFHHITQEHILTIMFYLSLAELVQSMRVMLLMQKCWVALFFRTIDVR